MLAGQAATLQLIHGATEGPPGGPGPVFPAGDLPDFAADANGDATLIAVVLACRRVSSCVRYSL